MECPKCHFENPDDALKCSNCATPLPSAKEISVTETLETPAEELTKGTTLASRYEIIEELGKGGMGRVYKVHDSEIKEKVALKLLKPEIAADKKSIERFRNELKIARKVSHKRVCRMYDIGKEEENYFITMEYVEGEDLKSLIREKGKLPENEVLRLARQICEGLAEAHELGIVHRDLKPQNIMIDKESNAKIMDFGIARSVEAPGVTQTGVIIGTPDYISPEQAEGKEADQRSDIYAMGIILYEMATGSVPFKGDTALSVAIKHKSQLPKEPRKLNPEVSKDLNRMILICMEKDRERRYQKAEDLLSDIRNIEEGFPLGSKIQPRRMTFMATLIQNKLFIPSAALVVIAVLVIIWQFMPKETAVQIDPNKPSLAILYFKNNTGDEGLDHWRNALAEWLITDISQSKYIDVLPDNRLFSILRNMKLLEAENYATEDLKRIADEGNVNHLIQASYSKAGDIFRIDYSLLSADSLEPIGSDSVSGEGEKSFPTIVDEITRKIKINLEFSEKEIANDIDEDIGKITTSALEAFKYYSEGRRLLASGDYKLSISFMEKAIEIDPEFAMAYRSMGASYISMFNKEESLKYSKKAFELSDRVSVREKYLIQGSYYDAERNFEKAIEALNKLLELYPDDYTGNHNLGRAYSIIGEDEKAKKHFELAYLKNKTSYPTTLSLTNTYEQLGLIDKAIEVWENYSNNVPDNINAHVILNSLYIGKGRYDLALEEAEKIYALNPKRRFWYEIYYLQGNFPAAEKEAKLESEIDEEWPQSLGREKLANLYCTQGQFEKAEEQLREGIKQAEQFKPTRDNILWISRFHFRLANINLLKGDLEEALKNADVAWKRAEEYEWRVYQRRALMKKAYAYLKMKSLDEALKVADELKQEIEESSPYEKVIQRLMRYYNLVMGKIEQEKGNYLKAIKYFNEALSLNYQDQRYKPVDYIEALAFAYYKSGKLEEARKEYEKIPLLTNGRLLEYGYIYPKSFYMLGKIYEQQKKKKEAIKHYEKFLSLCKDADPGIAEVEDAKKKLAGLNKQIP